MDPYYERRLRDEVIYLHSLWHQGPRRPPQPTPTGLLHQPSNPTEFKKQKIKPKGKKGKKSPQEKQSGGENSGKEWPCNPTSSSTPATTYGWPTIWPVRDSQTLLPSPEEKAKLAANQAQIRALKVTKEFFKSNNENDDEGSDDDDDLMEEEDGGEEYRFFVKVFMEDSELKEYYEKNYQDGKFSCLVCGGLGKKNAGKKFKNCVALIQHSITIARTKKRRAHRAYGQAICKVLGWDIDRLPSIVSALSEKHLSLNNAAQGETEDKGKDEGKDEKQANVCEETEGGSISTVLENKEGSMDVNNSGQGEIGENGEGKGEAQENVGEGTMDASTALESKEGFLDVNNSGHGEAGGKGEGEGEAQIIMQANVDEGAMDSSTALENIEAPGDGNNSGDLLVKESVNSENKKLLINGESTISEKSSFAAAEVSESPEDFSQTVSQMLEVEPPKEERIVGVELDAFLDAMIQTDAPT